MGAAAKVDTKVTKKPSHEQWKDTMWGKEKVHGRSAHALFSESTGMLPKPSFSSPVDKESAPLSAWLWIRIKTDSSWPTTWRPASSSASSNTPRVGRRLRGVGVAREGGEGKGRGRKRTDADGTGLDRLAAGHAAHGAPGLRIDGHTGTDTSLHVECLLGCKGCSKNVLTNFSCVEESLGSI